MSVSIAPSALAQSDLSTQDPIPTALQIQVTNASAIVMSAAEVTSVVRGAARQSVAESLSAIATTSINHHLEGASEILRSGGVVQFSTAVCSKDQLTNRRLANVRVRYDSRPIGGIVTVRVELVPLFAGVGAASRADISRDYAQAVDSFDDEAISNTIIRLTHDMAADYASEL